MNLKEHLEQRWYLHQYTDEKVFELFSQWWHNFYLGVDLSADSMTIGNFVALMMAINIMSYGNKCYLLVGGATSTIGNPSGKDSERPILAPEQLAHNQAKIAEQFSILCNNITAITGKNYDFEIINNTDFFKNMNTLDYIREVGRYITVNWMLNKDIVKKRIEDPDKSITYAEFSYMLIMGYDFYYLFKNHKVIMEVGGSDEWDGILTGIELVHKKAGETVYGITNKLITDSTGKKFGKSEGNAIWLSPEKNSPYVCYNYFINTMDEDVKRYMRLFTFLDEDQISAIITEHEKNSALRYGQQQLAYHVTALIFGEQAAKESIRVKDILYAPSWDDTKQQLLAATPEEIVALCKATEWVTTKTTTRRILELLVETWLYESNSEAKKWINGNAISLNGNKITDISYELTTEDFINSIALLKKGKKQYASVQLTQ